MRIRISERPGVASLLSTLVGRIPFLRSPEPRGDHEASRIALFLHEFLLLLLAFAGMFVVLGSLFPSVLSRTFLLALSLLPVPFIGMWLNRRGRTRLASVLSLGLLFIIVSLMSLTGGGIYSPAFATYPVIILGAGLLLGVRAAWLGTLLSGIMGVVLLRWGTGDGAVVRLVSHSPETYVGSMVGVFVAFALTIRLYLRSLQKTTDRAAGEIHERQRMTAQLAANEALLTAVLDSTKDLILAADLNMRVTSANKPFREYARAAQGIDVRAGEPVLEYIESSRRSIVGDAIRRVFAGESLALINERMTSDGRHLYLVESYSPILNAAKVVEGVTIYTRDMSDWIRMDRALRESEERLRAVVENIPVIVFAIDGDGVFRLSEGKGLAALGLRPGEVVGRSAFDIYRDNADVLKSLHRVLGGEAHVTTVDIGGIVYETYYAPLTDVNGTVTGSIGVAMDITEQRRAMEKLREQASLLDRAHDAIIVKDLAGSITYWNREASLLYGWPREQALGRQEEELLYEPPHRDLVLRALDATVAQGEWNGELPQRTKEGKEVLVDSRWSLITDDTGRPRSILSINIDITEKKSLERQLIRSQRLESLGTLAGGIAHDLNNVLTPILMSIDGLRLRHQDAKTLRTLDTIESGAQRGADIIRQLLMFARGMKGEFTPIQPGLVVKDVEQIIRGTFPKSIETLIHIAPDLWTVVGDSTQIHQVVLNLCVNARDAMPDGGILSVRATNAVLSATEARMNPDARAGRYIEISVTDTGTGIKSDHLDKIFDPFFTTKEVGKGTGLGLSTALTIVKNHGGFVQVESAFGAGSTFRIYLPAAPEAEGAARGSALAADRTGSGELILVVDDEEFVREVATEALEAAGYRVLVAHDGATALRVFSSRKDEIALVLTDIVMPTMDGVSLLRKLKEIHPGVRVTAMSGMLDSDYLENMRPLGINAVLHKPFSSADLLLWISGFLRQAPGHLDSRS